MRLTPGERMVWAQIYVRELRQLEVRDIEMHRQMEEQFGKRVIIPAEEQRRMANHRRFVAATLAADEVHELRRIAQRCDATDPELAHAAPIIASAIGFEEG